MGALRLPAHLRGARTRRAYNRGVSETAKRVALIDSGKGLLPTAKWIHRLAPEVEVLLETDPEGGPWGERDPGDVVERVFAMARHARDHGANAIALACNTASIVAREPLREQFEPRLPIIATVPAVKPAAARHQRFAVWATATTARSEYLEDLISVFATGRDVSVVGSHDLAAQIEAGDEAGIETAVQHLVAETPKDVEAVVLGCTHYPLVSDVIARHLPEGVALFDSAEAVARQTLRRMRIAPSADVAAFAADSSFAAAGVRRADELEWAIRHHLD